MYIKATTIIDELLNEIMFPKVKENESESLDKLSIKDKIMLLEDDLTMTDEDIEYCLGKIKKYQSELERLLKLKEKLNKEYQLLVHD